MKTCFYSKRSRAYALFLVFVIAGMTGCQVLRVESTRLGDASWPTEGQTPQRGQSTSSHLAPPLEKVWSQDIDGAVGGTSPLVSGETVLVANLEGEVHALSLLDGEHLSTGEFGDGIEGTPALHEQTLFVPIAKGGEAIAAYDLVRGKNRWTREGSPLLAGLLYLDGRVIGGDDQGRISAWEASSGQIEWSHSLQPVTTIHAAPLSPRPDAVVVADAEGGVRLFDARDGTVAWEAKLDAPVYVSPASKDSTIYVSTTRGRLYALGTENGGQRWRYALPDSTVRLAAPAVGKDLVVFGASDGSVRALDRRTGQLLWSFDAKEPVTAAPLLAGGTVYAGAMNGNLYAINAATGQQQWKTQLEGRIKSPMAAAGNRLVVLSEPNLIHLFKSSAPSKLSAAN